MGSVKLYVVLLLALAAFCSLAPQKVESVTVLQYLQQQFPNGIYKYFLEYPALAADLNNPTKPFTVFAPLDTAFNGTIPAANTTNTPAYYHVASGSISPSSLTFGGVIRTLLQPEPQLGGYNQVLIVGTTNKTNPVVYTINDAEIFNHSSNLENGIVYTIDRLLTPTTTYVEDIVHLGYPILSTLVTLANVSLKIHPVTLFAPQDAGFNALPSALVSYLSMGTPMSNGDLTKIIEYHGHAGAPVYTGDLSLGGRVTISTLLGSTSNLTLHKPQHYPAEPVVVIDSTGAESDIIAPNTLAYNGVVHGINEVLVPPPSQFQFTLEKAILGLGATKFLTALQQSGLYNYLLNDTTHRTLIVPTNNALANINVTSEALLYHALAGSYNQAQLVDGYLLTSLATPQPLLNNSAQLLKFEQTNSTLYVNGFAVLNSTATINTAITNYVYLIDSVLPLPGLVADVLANNGYSILVHAVGVAGLDWINNASLTVFAPSNDAFNMLPPGSLGYLLNANYSGDLLRNVLYGHIVDPEKVNDKIFYSTDIPTGRVSVPAVNGANLVITKTEGNVTVNNSMVEYPDLLAANGVAHGINRVIVPPGFSFSLQNLLEGLGNYTRLLDYLTQTGLINTLNSNNITIFAPDDEAFEQVKDLDAITSNNDRLKEVLLAHVVAQSISSLSTNDSFATGIPGQNIAVIGTTPYEVELKNVTTGEAIGNSAAVNVITYGRNGYAYGINRVLGVEQSTGGGGGLKTWQLVLIVVGSVVGGLLLLVLVLAVFYFVYHVFYKNKSGYRKIND